MAQVGNGGRGLSARSLGSGPLPRILSEVAQRFDQDVASASKGACRLAEQAEVSEKVQSRIAHLLEELKCNWAISTPNSEQST